MFYKQVDAWPLFILDNILSYEIVGSCEEKKENYTLCIIMYEHNSR